MEPIDYAAAADRLIDVLGACATRLGARPMPAVNLARHVFRDQFRNWTHETRRRRIRDTVQIAREALRLSDNTVELVANGEGYWLAGDAGSIRFYAARRRRHGLQQFARAAQVMRSPAAVSASGQGALFPSPAPARRDEAPPVFRR